MLTGLIVGIDGEVDLAMSGIMNLVPAGAETRFTSFLEKVEEIGKGRWMKSDRLIYLGVAHVTTSLELYAEDLVPSGCW
jgi:hypothetical protein